LKIIRYSTVLILLFLGACTDSNTDGGDYELFRIISDNYYVPNSLNPSSTSSEGFRFYINFPQAGIVKAGPTPSNSINVMVLARGEHQRSHYYLERTTNNLNHSKVNDGFDIYNEEIGKNGQTPITYYIKTDTKGQPIVITHPDGLNLRAYRSIDNNIELDYVFSKELDMADWDTLDELMISILESFKQPPNKTPQPTAKGGG